MKVIRVTKVISISCSRVTAFSAITIEREKSRDTHTKGSKAGYNLTGYESRASIEYCTQLWANHLLNMEPDSSERMHPQKLYILKTQNSKQNQSS